MAFSTDTRTATTAFALILTGGGVVLAVQAGLFGAFLCCAIVAGLLTFTLVSVRASIEFPVKEIEPLNNGEGERIQLRLLLDEAPVPLVSVEGSKVRAINRAARQLFKTEHQVDPVPEGLLRPDRQRIRIQGRNWRIDRVAIQGVEPARTVVALADVEAEEQAAEARAARELLKVVGHEVLNTLAPISSLAESAAEIFKNGGDRQLLEEIFGTLSRRAEGLQRFTTGYRLLARVPEPQLNSVSLRELCNDLEALFAAQWRSRVELIIKSCNDCIQCDRDQITQAVWALLQNAAEAALCGPKTPLVQLRARLETHVAVLAVSDSGPGLDPSTKEEAFRPFFTTKQDGTGVGLSLARQIAQGHGGDILLSPDDLTTFECTLPIEPSSIR